MKHNIITVLTLTTLVLCGVIFLETDFLWFVLGTILFIYLGVTAYGSYQIQANYFINSVNRGKKKSIALTFDDGPDPEFTPKILDILSDKNVKATFFVIGKKAEKYPDLIRRIADEGHTLANHSYSHHYLIAFFSTSRLAADLKKCNDVLTGLLGKTPVFFRPPFGVTNPFYSSAIKQNGLISVGWSLRSMDTRAQSKYALIDAVISKLKKGDIVLLHDRLSVTAEALPDIIEHINTKKFAIEALSAVINKDAYVKD